MANKMLIDATHPEETRVVVLRGNRVEEFDFETAHRKQLRGNIYLAKVTRVEPSLQAAFVEYGGNRHGFLAFSEIHPDYYQIPVADRQALIEADARDARENDSDEDHNHRGGRRHRRHRERAYSRREETMQGDAPTPSEMAPETVESSFGENATAEALPDQPPGFAQSDELHGETQSESHGRDREHETAPADEHEHAQPPIETASPLEQPQAYTVSERPADETPDTMQDVPPSGEAMAPAEAEHAAATVEDSGADTQQAAHEAGHENGRGADEEEELVESVGGADAMEEVPDRAPRYRRQYKIQEVIKRRQVMLVQVVKEERGTKGAALTTYLSLAGRYCVLMPNTARGGGISRKITSAEDRKKLREIAEELEVPEGMGVILRTAGAARTKQEVKRDFEYLLRIWEQVRDLTLKSTAPTLVYEEGSLAKRSIRDLYTKDIDEIVVAGEQGYRDAKEFMRMLMPSHAKNVKLYNDSQPVFTRYGIESQLDAMFSPTVQLRSGGYIVINQTEALVSIDVNSGRSTREHHIEDTALKTNVEAAEEVARQLRLRDLAGLIVIDFIDMDEKRNNRTVERRLKDALRNDRARIQVGRISHFGLLEMSRQRIRTSVLESSTEKCPHCGGTGHVRSISSVALQLLRSIEEMLLKGPTHNLIVRTRPEIALYVLNHKRAHLSGLEQRFHVTLTVNADGDVGGQTGFLIERGEQVMTPEQARTLLAQTADTAPVLVEEEEPERFDALDEEAEAETGGTERGEQAEHAGEGDIGAQLAHGEAREGGRGRRRRRRRGRGGRSGEGREQREGDQFPQLHQAQGSIENSEFGAEQALGFAPTTGELAMAGDVPAEQDYAAYQEGNEVHGHGNGSSREGNGEHRRRRRGRRGGRRSRRDRDQNNGDFAAGEHREAQSFETHTRPDYGEQRDWSPPRETAGAEPPSSPPFEAAPQPPSVAEAAAPAPAEPPPRRRSTVREPAPNFGSGASAVTSMPAPQPPPIASGPGAETEETNKPRRTGWWAKKLLGGGKD